MVYLGEAPGGRRVAVKMLGAGLDDPDARTRFQQEIGYARRVKAFCTAQVLASGELNGSPYVVSEFVDGPSLAEMIRERGALRGAELRRLAIGTLTALSAIHQAGVVHRDFKPGNVLLSRDGPRVIDFGISRALEESELAGEHLVGTPPYMAPEQFGGRPAEPAADMFAWASTMVAAATGTPPFGTGDVPALINRILSAEPDLGDLDEELRDLVARCLAKDPRARPTAARALLGLLGHHVPERQLLAEGQQSAAPPAGRLPGRRRWLVAGAVTAAVAITAAVLLTRPAPPPGARTPSLIAAPLPAPREGRMGLTSTAKLKIPDTRITLYENPADPIWVSSYHDQRNGTGYPSYVRDPATGTFGYFGGWEEPIVSPGGGYVASLSATRFRAPEFETLRIRDRVTGQDRQLRTVDKPATLFRPNWSADGRRWLATVIEDQEQDRVVGFAVVDPAAGTVKLTKVAGGNDVRFGWGADGKSVLYGMPGGAVRVVDLEGRPVRTFTGVGELYEGGVARTTLGLIFSTKCPDISVNVCFWDAENGAKKGVARLPKGGAYHGWLDDAHFLAGMPDGKNTDVVLADATGRTVRKLATGPKAEITRVALWFTRK
ncbi:serine/threonine protein kinase [Nonomuraea sp. NPDC050451]|uniref:serine/threonine protein kinase n=1 Tax=Nonomuraea sp. NPDC050451 TaxID=3364364 RepID=UPI00378EF2EA